MVLVRAQVEQKTTDRALRILNGVWSDILASMDDDLIAYAKEVRAHTLMTLFDQVVEERQTAGEHGKAALEEAARLLEEAANLRLRLGCTSKYIENLKKLATLYHNRLEDISARDDAAKRCRTAINEWQASRRDLHHDQMRRFELVQRICAYASAVVAAS